jgi:hypothetical protein
MIDRQTVAQTVANDIRDHLLDNPLLCRVGMEVLWVAAMGPSLRVRLRHRDRVLTLERGPGWADRPAALLARELAHELVGEALGTCRPIAPAPAASHPLDAPARPAPFSHRA